MKTPADPVKVYAHGGSHVTFESKKMRDIGKIISVYFYALALCSFLSMLYLLIIQKQTYFELTWVALVVFGNLMWKHNNAARRLVIGFNIICLILFAVSIAAGVISEPNAEAIKIFSIAIPDPTETQLWGFISYFVLSSLVLIILLLSKKAKIEFSNQREDLTRPKAQR